MLAKGEHKVNFLKSRGHIPLIFKIGDEPVKIRRDEITKYVNDPTFLIILEYYNLIKLWGMPDHDGWADMPIDVLEGITALELESKSMENEAMEAHSSNNVNITNNPSGISSRRSK